MNKSCRYVKGFSKDPVLIPGCMAVAQSQNIQDCICDPEPNDIHPPRRAFEVEIKIGTETKEYLLWKLKEVFEQIEERGDVFNSISASPRDNSSIIVYEDPTMTLERYLKELEEYLITSAQLDAKVFKA